MYVCSNYMYICMHENKIFKKTLKLSLYIYQYILHVLDKSTLDFVLQNLKTKQVQLSTYRNMYIHTNELFCLLFILCLILKLILCKLCCSFSLDVSYSIEVKKKKPIEYFVYLFYYLYILVFFCCCYFKTHLSNQRYFYHWVKIV